MSGHRSHEEYEEHFEQSLDLMAIADLGGRIQRVNPSFTRLLGWTEGDLGESSFLSFIHPADVAESARRLTRLATGVPLTDFRTRCRTKDGDYRSIEWSAVARGPRLHATGRDVTERVETADRFARSDEYIRSVLDTVVDGIITIDDHGTIQSVNRAVLRTFGYEPGELVGRNVSLLMPEPDRSRHDDYLDRYAETGEAHIIGVGRQVVAVRKDGTTFPLFLSVDEFRSGGRVYYTGALQDATIQVEAYRQLEEARAAAEAANRAKTDFLSRASHELRTPLNAIIGFAQLMEMQGDESSREAIGTILGAGRHLLALITDMLDVSRIEAGELQLVAEPVEIDEIVRECAVLLEPTGDARITTAPTGGLVVSADRRRVRQVLLNLLSNALKYGGDGEVTVAAERTPAGMVEVTVADRGPGIPPHLHAALFRPFDRLGMETSEIEGSGLGLTVSSRLVSLMGGEMGVRSTVGRGARFWFTLPSHE